MEFAHFILKNLCLFSGSRFEYLLNRKLKTSDAYRVTSEISSNFNSTIANKSKISILRGFNGIKYYLRIPTCRFEKCNVI